MELINYTNGTESLFNNITSRQPSPLLKKFGASVFLYILRKSSEHIFEEHIWVIVFEVYC